MKVSYATPAKSHQVTNDGRLATKEVIALRAYNKKDLVALIEELYHVLYMILMYRDYYNTNPAYLWEMMEQIDETKILWNDVDLYNLPKSFEKYRSKMHRRYKEERKREKRREYYLKEKAEKNGEEPPEHVVTKAEAEEQYYGRVNIRNW